MVIDYDYLTPQKWTKNVGYDFFFREVHPIVKARACGSFGYTVIIHLPSWEIIFLLLYKFYGVCIVSEGGILARACRGK